MATDETRIIGNLPHLRLELVHRQDADGMCEHITLHLTATPSFQAAERLLLGGGWGGDPWALWTSMAEAMLAPWRHWSDGNPWLRHWDADSAKTRE